MPAALSPDLRKRVIGAVEAGSSCRQAAERFGVGEGNGDPLVCPLPAAG